MVAPPRRRDASRATPRHQGRDAMTPLAKSRNIAARMGRWSASHKKTAIFGWLAFVAVAFVFGNHLGTKNIDQAKNGAGESGRAQVILADNFKQPAHEDVFVQSQTLTTSDPAFRAVVQDVVRTLSTRQNLQNIRSPF